MLLLPHAMGRTGRIELSEGGVENSLSTSVALVPLPSYIYPLIHPSFVSLFFSPLLRAQYIFHTFIECLEVLLYSSSFVVPRPRLAVVPKVEVPSDSPEVLHCHVEEGGRTVRLE
jgi:hypothetical protein